MAKIIKEANMLRLVKQGGRIQRGGIRVSHWGIGSCGSVIPCGGGMCSDSTKWDVKFNNDYAAWWFGIPI